MCKNKRNENGMLDGFMMLIERDTDIRSHIHHARVVAIY